MRGRRDGRRRWRDAVPTVRWLDRGMPVEMSLSTGIGRPLSFANGGFDTTRGIISPKESFTAWVQELEHSSRTEASKERNPWVNFKQYLLECNQILTERFNRNPLF